ncbi:phytanoyl-CoA dioxygenase family protein [Afipia birgiae]|jgi:hypothetical protein|uniref:phytanoyl-CoA dioxygenase family protein n=1 Tax=Afipia birgiae TaxID=151414 RepID=UPI00031FC628|nr:phytanoyl-CoA dioxygenase family protein [Afipia birgiae]
MNVVADNLTSPKYFYPRIDYRAHPAFRDLDVAPYARETEVNALISAIDLALEKMNVSRLGGDAEIDRVFDLEVAARVAALQDFLSETITDQRTIAWLNRSFALVMKDLRERIHVVNRRHETADHRAKSPLGSIVARDLERDGAHICKLDRESHEKLLALCAPFMKELRERSKSQPNERIVHNFELYGAVGSELLSFFRREGILDGLSSYVGSNVNFSGFALEYSYARQKWWRGVYSDIGLADSNATYMHYDKGSRDPKAIIAITDVTEENGPTSFVRGSHKQNRSTFLHFMMTALDYGFQAEESHPAVGANYRPRFASERYRRELLSLPTALQGSSHFGDDVLDGTALSDELLRNEIRMTKDVGNCIVFDGNYGIHRGALVRSGERFVFQVIFDIAPPLSLMTRLKLQLRWLALKYLKGQR